jgi:hypothetical protein
MGVRVRAGGGTNCEQCACKSLEHVDLRGTRLVGDVRALLRTLSPIENNIAQTPPVHFKHVDTRLVAQAPWHGVVRSLADWNEVVRAIGQTTDLKSSSNSIAPPIDFKTHMVRAFTSTMDGLLSLVCSSSLPFRT